MLYFREREKVTSRERVVSDTPYTIFVRRQRAAVILLAVLHSVVTLYFSQSQSQSPAHIAEASTMTGFMLSAGMTIVSGGFWMVGLFRRGMTPAADRLDIGASIPTLVVYAMTLVSFAMFAIYAPMSQGGRPVVPLAAIAFVIAVGIVLLAWWCAKTIGEAVRDPSANLFFVYAPLPPLTAIGIFLEPLWIMDMPMFIVTGAIAIFFAWYGGEAAIKDVLGEPLDQGETQE